MRFLEGRFRHRQSLSVRASKAINSSGFAGIYLFMRRLTRLFQAVGIGCLALVAVSQVDAHQHASQQVVPSSTSEQPEPQQNAVPQVQPSPNAAQEQRRREEANIDTQREMAASTRAISQDTKRAADYTLMLVVVGGGAAGFELVLTFWQLRLTRKNVKIAEMAADRARDVFLMTNRPRIIAKDVWTETEYFGGIQSLIDHSIFDWQKERPNISMAYRLVNMGASTATIRATGFDFVLGLKLPTLNPVRAIPVNPITLSPGDSVSLTYSQSFTEQVTGRREQGQTRLFVVGIVVYADQAERERRTGFCRAWNPATKRFDRVRNEPDYEYRD
jgi:hypothetical protein